MKIIVANKQDYINYNAKITNKLKTFELEEDTEDYIMNRVELGDKTQDISLLDSCINNLLDEQYDKREYIKLEEIQEVNDLVSKLNKEECRILNAYAEVKKYHINGLNEIKELIANINDYQIIEKYNLHELGVLIAEKVPGYKMDINVIPFMNFAKLAENYLFDANIKERFCSYGLLINTREMLDNELIKPKISNEKILKVEIVNKELYEEGLNDPIMIYLPEEAERIREKFRRINLDYDNITLQDTHTIKCELLNNIDDELTRDFNKLMKNMIEKFEKEEGYTTPFQEIKNFCMEIQKLDNIGIKKFLMLVYLKQDKIKYINNLTQCAEDSKKYELLPDVRNQTEMGKYLVNETGHFDEVGLLEDYIDYAKLANDYTKRGCIYNGIFTKYGYLMEKENLEEEQESEEEFE